MEKKQIKKPVIYGVSLCMIVLLLSVLYYVNGTNKNSYQGNEDYKYVSRLFDEEEIPVVKTNALMMRPYNHADVKIIQNFYDYKAKESEQEKSIINYDTTYIQNNGVAYGGIEENFDVVSILDGTVQSVKEDKLLGKIITIDHGNNIISEYQSLSEVTVKENTQVTQGTIIGKAGNSNMGKNLGSHVLLKLTVDENIVNPENCYDKTIEQIKNK